MVNYDWYGSNAKLIEQTDNCFEIEYGCKGRGMVSCYNVYQGVQVNFMDFDTLDLMPSQKFNSNIITISHCKAGRYECEFPNHTMAYLPESYFSINGTKYLPVSFSFPLGRYIGLSIVIDKQVLDPELYELMNSIPIDLKEIGNTLNLEERWYVSMTPPKLKHLFSELYKAKGIESIGYFRIKVMELLYHMNQLTENRGCDFRYFDKGQIQKTKKIRDYLVENFESRVSIEDLVKKSGIGATTFHQVFLQIYGETPYAYLKKYKMNFAAKVLLESDVKISDIASELGYSNSSKFAKAFYSVYGVLPREYRKKM